MCTCALSKSPAALSLPRQLESESERDLLRPGLGLVCTSLQTKASDE